MGNQTRHGNPRPSWESWTLPAYGKPKGQCHVTHVSTSTCTSARCRPGHCSSAWLRVLHHGKRCRAPRLKKHEIVVKSGSGAAPLCDDDLVTCFTLQEGCGWRVYIHADTRGPSSNSSPSPSPLAAGGRRGGVDRPPGVAGPHSAQPAQLRKYFTRAHTTVRLHHDQHVCTLSVCQ